MLELNTIADFQALPANLQAEVQKALRTKDRLDDFLRTLNKKAGTAIKPEHEARWEECRSCKPFGHPGWVWKEQGRDDSDLHPSQMNKCVKFLYYSCTGQVAHLEEYVDPRLRLIFDMGHAWHDTVQRYGRMGAWCPPEFYHPEVPIDPDAMTVDGVTPVLPIAHQYWIRGSADALIDRYVCKNVPGLGDVSVRLIHEYKTINNNGYTKLTRPKPEHKFQATIYSAVFNVPLVVYLYTNKDNCYVADFPVPFDNSIWSEVVKKVIEVQAYVEDGLEPPWEVTSAVKAPQECMECGFRKLCAPPLAKAQGRRSA